MYLILRSSGYQGRHKTKDLLHFAWGSLASLALTPRNVKNMAVYSETQACPLQVDFDKPISVMPSELF